MTGKILKRGYFFCSIASVLILSACGLPTYIYLYPPLDFFSPSANRLQIDHDINNYDSTEGANQSFKGYEIYYRAYDNATAAQTDINLLISNASIYSDYPTKFKLYAENTLHFVRLRIKENNSSPLISITNPSIDGISYYVYLNANSDWKLNNGSVDTASLARNIASQDFNSRYSFFSQANYQSGDADYEGANSPGTVYFAFFTIAFGSDSFESVYSDPSIISSPILYSPGLL